MSRALPLLVAATLAATVAAACTNEVVPLVPSASSIAARKAAPEPPPAVELRWYDAVVEDAELDLAFRLGLPPVGTDGEARLMNGKDELRAPVTWQGDVVTIDFPLYATRITATVEPDGAVAGTWQGTRLLDLARPMHATPAAPPPADPAPVPAALLGTWRLDVADYGVSKATIEPDPTGGVGVVVLLPGAGDIGYMHGDLDGGVLTAYRFDGQRAWGIKAKVDLDGKTLDGEWILTGLANRVVTGKKVDAFADKLPERVHLAGGADRIELPELAALRGKAVIVDLMGTWCASCHFEIEVLVDFFNKHHDAGLEIVSIAYEFVDDEAYARAQVDKFRKAYKVPWTMRIVASEPDQLARLVPKPLVNVEGLPVLIFINRDGTVHAIHSGFFEPTAGDDYKNLVADLERLTAEILASAP